MSIRYGWNCLSKDRLKPYGNRSQEDIQVQTLYSNKNKIHTTCISFKFCIFETMKTQRLQ